VTGSTLRDELAAATPHGGLYLRRLVRAQLALSLLALVAFGGLVGGLPLAVYLLPGLDRVRLLGIPLPVVAVLWPPFPLLVAIGWLYSRRAEAFEEAFRELVHPSP
jgi:hypothetical protein